MAVPQSVLHLVKLDKSRPDAQNIVWLSGQPWEGSVGDDNFVAEAHTRDQDCAAVFSELKRSGGADDSRVRREEAYLLIDILKHVLTVRVICHTSL